VVSFSAPTIGWVLPAGGEVIFQVENGEWILDSAFGGQGSILDT
jgi:hypothetical protein